MEAVLEERRSCENKRSESTESIAHLEDTYPEGGGPGGEPYEEEYPAL